MREHLTRLLAFLAGLALLALMVPAMAPSARATRVVDVPLASTPTALPTLRGQRVLPTAEVALPARGDVLAYDPRTGIWSDLPIAELVEGDEVLLDGRLVHLGADGPEDRGPATLTALKTAGSTASLESEPRTPSGSDWVRVLGDEGEAGHWRLRDLEGEVRFAFDGWLFETRRVRGELQVRSTGDVVSRAVQTMVRASDTLIDAEIRYQDGTVEVITGTPEHPFWVPAKEQWVPLGELESGTELHLESGAGALLVSSTWRQGDFTVYNFEVENQHNYFVRAPGGDEDALLVHNTGCRVDLGAKYFMSSDELSGFAAESVIKHGDNLTLENFTMASIHRGRDLVGPMRELLDFAKEHGAKSITVRGSFINEDLAKRFGMDVNEPFEVTFEASREGISQALRGAGAAN